MTKKQLLNNKEISYYGLPNDVSGISIDSRKVNKGDIFFLICASEGWEQKSENKNKVTDLHFASLWKDRKKIEE